MLFSNDTSHCVVVEGIFDPKVMEQFSVEVPDIPELPTQNVDQIEEDNEEIKMAAGGSLLPTPTFKKGHKYITILLEKIGLKEAMQYLDPVMEVHVCGKH